MQANEFTLDLLDEEIFVQTINFGKSIYIYIGQGTTKFDDLSFSMPSTATTHLMGDAPSDELATYLSQILKQPVLTSYNYKLETEKDLKRFDFVKVQLRKKFTGK